MTIFDFSFCYEHHLYSALVYNILEYVIKCTLPDRLLFNYHFLINMFVDFLAHYISANSFTLTVARLY